MAVAKRKKDPAAVALGRKGGKKGGPARAAKLTPAQRSESARKAVQARWAKAKKADDYIVGKERRMGIKRFSEFRKQIDEAVHVPVNTSDRAALDILSRIKATKDLAEIKNLSAQLEQVIFHKQHSHS
jgi:hypothetical protein